MRAWRAAFGAALIAVAALGGAAATAHAGEARVLPMIGSQRIVTPVSSITAMRFARMERQLRDVSCGAAALATVLRHFYGHDQASEQSIIEGVMSRADEAQRRSIAQAGFSMLELKREAERRGLVAGGFRMPDAASLASLRVPAITLIDVRGYSHFVVVRKLEGDEVLIANPAFGNRVMPVREFERRWRGVVLVVVDPNSPGDQAWRAFRGANDRRDPALQLAYDVRLGVAPGFADEF